MTFFPLFFIVLSFQHSCYIAKEDPPTVIRILHSEITKKLHHLLYEHSLSDHKRITVNLKELKEICIACVQSPLLTHSIPHNESGKPKIMKSPYLQYAPELIERRFQTEPVKPYAVSLLLHLPNENTPKPIPILAIKCFETPQTTWSIIDISDDQYYTICRKNHPVPEDHYTLSGQLIPLAKHNGRTLNTLRAMDTSFEDSAKAFDKEPTRARDICRLSPLKRLEACAATYKFVEPDMSTETDFHSINNVDDSCVRNASVLLKNGLISKNFKATGLGIFLCSINQELSFPQYYITADQVENESVFILIKTELHHEGSPVYSLNTRLNHVVTLKNAF